jgi:hypothetical protein
MDLDVFLLILRILLLILLYLFLWQVIRAVRADLRRASSGAGVPSRHQPLSASLVVIDPGPLPLAIGQRIPLQARTTLGRSPTNTIVLEDSFVSSEHALLFWHDKQWWIQDMQSRNGTLLNQQRILQPAAIKQGDTLQIGNVKFKFVLEPPHANP